jgi:hypothetical protein
VNCFANFTRYLPHVIKNLYTKYFDNALKGTSTEKCPTRTGWENPEGEENPRRKVNLRQKQVARQVLRGYLSPAAQQDLQPIYDHRYMRNNFEIRVGTNLHAIERPINRAARCSAAGDMNSVLR